MLRRRYRQGGELNESQRAALHFLMHCDTESFKCPVALEDTEITTESRIL